MSSLNKGNTAILLGIVLASFLLLHGCNRYEIYKVRTQLQSEVDAYHTAAARKAARKSFDLASPFLTDEQCGEYDQRLRGLDQPGTVIGFHIPSDWHDNVISDLREEIKHWGARPHERVDWHLHVAEKNPYDLPYNKVWDLSQCLQKLFSLSYRLESDDAPSSREEIANCRREFEVLVAQMEALF